MIGGRGWLDTFKDVFTPSKEKTPDLLMTLAGVAGPTSTLLSAAMAIGTNFAQGNPRRDPYDLSYDPSTTGVQPLYVSAEERAAYDAAEEAQRKKTREASLAWAFGQKQRDMDAALAKAKASYDPVKAQIDALNKQKVGQENQKAYQQRAAISKAAQMAATKAQNVSVAAQTAQRQAAEATKDKADFTNAIQTNITEEQKAYQEAQRIQRERTANLSLALKTRLGILDQQKATQKEAQAQTLQMMANQIKQQSDSQTELQKIQAAQALARKGIKTVGGKIKRKKPSMTY